MTAAATNAGRCGACRSFQGGALALERAHPAMAALSSAHGANRSDDGLCRLHQRHVGARSSCPAYAQA